jgi:hypothetical protein
MQLQRLFSVTLKSREPLAHLMVLRVVEGLVAACRALQKRETAGGESVGVKGLGFIFNSVARLVDHETLLYRGNGKGSGVRGANGGAYRTSGKGAKGQTKAERPCDPVGLLRLLLLAFPPRREPLLDQGRDAGTAGAAGGAAGGLPPAAPPLTRAPSSGSTAALVAHTADPGERRRERWRERRRERKTLCVQC